MANEKKSKTFAKDKFAVFMDSAKALGLSPYELCEKMGFSRNAWNGWEVADMVPFCVAELCRAYVALNSLSADGHDQVFMIRVPPGREQDQRRGVLEALVRGLGLEWTVV